MTSEYKKLLENQRGTLIMINTILVAGSLIGKIVENPYIVFGDVILFIIVYPVFLRDLRKRIFHIKQTDKHFEKISTLSKKIYQVSVVQYVIAIIYGVIFYLPAPLTYAFNIILYGANWHIGKKLFLFNKNT